MLTGGKKPLAARRNPMKPRAEKGRGGQRGTIKKRRLRREIEELDQTPWKSVCKVYERKVPISSKPKDEPSAKRNRGKAVYLQRCSAVHQATHVERKIVFSFQDKQKGKH